MQQTWRRTGERAVAVNVGDVARAGADDVTVMDGFRWGWADALDASMTGALASYPSVRSFVDCLVLNYLAPLGLARSSAAGQGRW